MTTSKVEIWNMALAYIGHERFILGANEQSTEQAFCSRFWDPLLEAELSKFDWSFANVRKSLAVIYDAVEDVDVDGVQNKNKVPDYRFVYAYPSDCIKPIYIIPGRLFDNKTEPLVYDNEVAIPREMLGRQSRVRVPYAIKIMDGKKVILTDEPEAQLDYIARIDDTSIYSPMFIQAMALQLARPLVAALAKDGKRISAIDAMYDDISAQAEVIEANSETDDQIPPESEFLRIRE